MGNPWPFWLKLSSASRTHVFMYTRIVHSAAPRNDRYMAAERGSDYAGTKNNAFVFLKPLAVTDKMKEVVRETFEKNGIKILKEGEIKSDRH